MFALARFGGFLIVCLGVKVSDGLRCLGDWPAFNSHEELARDPWSRYYDVSIILCIRRSIFTGKYAVQVHYL